MVFSTTTPRRPPVTVSWSSTTFALLTWVNTPAGSSAAVRAETVTSRDRVSSRPPLPSAEVLTAVTCVPVWLSRPIPKLPLPVVTMPVIGRSVLGPVTCTPYAPLCSARTPAIVVPRSPRRTRPVPAEPLTVTPSRCTPWEPSSWSPVPLRSNDVRTSDPVLPVWKSRPGWSSTSACSRPSRGAVPRSLSVASVAVNRPPGETRTNGRPGPGAIAWPEVRSTEVTVTPCRVRPPLPVEIDAASGAVAPPASCSVVTGAPTSRVTVGVRTTAAESRAVSPVIDSQSRGRYRSSPASVSVPPVRGTRRVRRPWSTRSTLVGRTTTRAVGRPCVSHAARARCAASANRAAWVVDWAGGAVGGTAGAASADARQPDRDGRGARGADDQPRPSAGPRVDPHAMPLSNRARGAL